MDPRLGIQVSANNQENLHRHQRVIKKKLLRQGQPHCNHIGHGTVKRQVVPNNEDTGASLKEVDDL